MTDCMIVDDSSVIRKLVRGILEPLKFSCTDAENGKIALDACLKKMPQLIMLDWNMPVMDGMEFLRQLRAAPGGKAPVIIFCTTDGSRERIEAAMTAGATDFIMKPFDEETVIGKLSHNGILEA